MSNVSNCQRVKVWSFRKLVRLFLAVFVFWRRRISCMKVSQEDPSNNQEAQVTQVTQETHPGNASFSTQQWENSEKFCKIPKWAQLEFWQNNPLDKEQKKYPVLWPKCVLALKSTNICRPKKGKLKWWQKDEIKYWNWTKWDVKLNKSKNHENMNEWIFKITWWYINWKDTIASNIHNERNEERDDLSLKLKRNHLNEPWFGPKLTRKQLKDEVTYDLKNIEGKLKREKKDLNWSLKQIRINLAPSVFLRHFWVYLSSQILFHIF